MNGAGDSTHTSDPVIKSPIIESSK